VFMLCHFLAPIQTRFFFRSLAFANS
jgi:hypothetical protein